MLGRLRIRQKLGVLLAIPLFAVALVMAAFTVERVTQARAYGATADAALAAREIGGLIQTLQQERLLSLGYLLIPSLDRSAVARESQAAIDEAARLATQPRTAAIMGRAQSSLAGLDGIRPLVLDRSATPIVTFYAYRSAIAGLMEALSLARPSGVVDADGLRELLALDALMRSNEEASSSGAIVLGTAVDAQFTAIMLGTVVQADALQLTRFRQLANPEQITLVEAVLDGEAASRLRAHIDVVLESGEPRTAEQISDALSAALSYTGLRRLAQDRVARDAALSAQQDAATATTTAWVVAVGAAVLFFGVAALATFVGQSIARPLRRLGRAVSTVAELSRAELVRVADSEALDRAPPELASVQVDSDDEIGELAAAVNRVQSTAAMLLERQATARANVATMFANVSRRTQTLVSRQLSMIDELRRQALDPETGTQLAQLEHVTTRLRRSADSLLVVSGTIDQQINAMPARLASVIDDAMKDIEGSKRVELVEPVPDVAVAAEVASDLRLLLAELLDNATNFTPPGSAIQIGATHEREASFIADATIAIVDHGLGMSPARMAEENRRLIERERLDVAPTRVLGLFVVGRLARRHSLTVRLEPTPGRGVTALVRIPARWLTPASAPSGPAGLGVVPPLAAAAIETAARSGPFPWLSARTDAAAPVSGAPVSAAPVTGAPVTGAPVTGAPVTGAPVTGAPVGGLPPGVAPALGLPIAATPPAPLPPRSPVPAAAVPPPPVRANGVRRRDPEAERAALDAFVSGAARAAAGPPPREPEPPPPPPGPPAGEPAAFAPEPEPSDIEPESGPPVVPGARTLDDRPHDSIPDEKEPETRPTLAERHQ